MRDTDVRVPLVVAGPGIPIDSQNAALIEHHGPANDQALRHPGHQEADVAN